MSWKPDRENASKYHFISMLIHGVLITLVALYALCYNREGPNWIKGYILSIIMCYILVIGTASINFGLIMYNPEPSWQITLLESLALFMDYLSWEIYFFVLILFTLFYYFNAKYNEHVASQYYSNS